VPACQLPQAGAGAEQESRHYDSLAARHGAATVLARADSTSAAVTATTMASLVPAVREGDHRESVQHAPSTSEAAQAKLAGSGCNRSATVESASTRHH
jgi:hypothetical protein